MHAPGQLEQLRERGLHVTEAIIYDTILAGEDDDELLKSLEEGGIHAMTFTSSSTVKNFMKMLKRMGVDDPPPSLKGVEVACIGPVTAKTAEDAGLNVTLMAKEATMTSLIDVLCEWKRAGGSGTDSGMAEAFARITVVRVN